MARNKTAQNFEQEIESALENKRDFCYETNFDSNPMVWAKKAKALGYRIELIFFCLDNIELAQQRVQYRTENNGHHVPDDIVEYK